MAEEQYLDRQMIQLAKTLTTNGMFFWREYEINRTGVTAYPFTFCDFVQNGTGQLRLSGSLMFTSTVPEGAQSNELLLARVQPDSVGFRDRWEYFTSWNGEDPMWNKEIKMRKSCSCVSREEHAKGEYFGWYSWLPSVVWNPGLKLYIMVNGGSYAWLWSEQFTQRLLRSMDAY